MADETLALFDDFSGGDWGVDLDGSMAPKNSWSGTDVVVYNSGLIGPRPGFKKISVTSMPSAKPLAVSFVSEAAAAKVAAVFDNGNVYTWAADSVTPTAAAMTEGSSYSANSYGSGEMIRMFGNSWAVSQAAGTGGLWISDQAGQLDKVSSGPSQAGSFAPFNGRMWVAAGGGATSNVGRVYYSAALDFATFASTTDYVDIGPGDEFVVALVPGRNVLYAFTQSEVYAISGTPGSTLAVRKVADVPYCTPGSFSRTYGGLIGFVSNSGVPHIFDGATVKQLRERRFSLVTEPYFNLCLRAGPDGLVFIPNGYASNNGTGGAYGRMPVRVFTGKHWVNFSLSRSGATDYMLWGNEMLPSRLNDKFLPYTTQQNPIEDFMVGLSRVANSGAPEYYLMRVANFNQPGESSAYDSQPGDGSNTPLTGSFTLPDTYSGDGSLLQVSKVVVHFRKYATGAGNAAFTVSLTPVGKYESGDGSAQTFSFSEAVPSSNADDVYHTPGFSRDFEAEGFRLAFTGLSCAAIRRVVVMGRKVPARP